MLRRGRKEKPEREGPSDVEVSLERPPRSLPPRLVDATLIVLAVLFYGGVLSGDIYENGWDGRYVAAIALAPAALALWWRRRRPLVVLAVALAVTVGVQPYPALFGIFALYTAASFLPPRRAFAAALLSAGCVFGGDGVAGTGIAWSDVITILVGVAVVAALGLYVGARRAYTERLKERALFARALASFLPAGVAELVQASPGALSLEQELEATILFSDIRGFSTVAEQLGPRAVAEIVGRHASAMAEVVLAHGGMLDKFAGDGVMAVFGAPKPSPDDADRAAECAIAMQRRQAELNAEAPPAIPSTEIGIGINTGQVVAGTLGGAGRLDYTVIGDAVNVAQRLQSEARAGEILASAATIGLITRVPAEPAGVRQLKGRQESVEVFSIGWQGRDGG